LGRFAGQIDTEKSLHVTRAQWVVLWSNFTPTNGAETSLAKATITAEARDSFAKDSVWVRIYAIE
jgi:hypothetical protein